jgi:HK97 family phage major capsid protein
MKKHLIGVHVEKNAYVDGGDGLITFPNGQVITDGTKQRNGTIYDIPSMDVSEYKGQVTEQHEDGLSTYLGEAIGVKKTNDAVTIDGIRFAVNQVTDARIAYDLMIGGFPLDLSIETYGPWPDESDDTYYNAKLVGLSVVIIGNNKSATMGKARMALVKNSLAQAKQDGLDTSKAERLLAPDEEPEPPAPKSSQEVNESTNKEQNKMFKTIKNSRDFSVPVKYKNAAGDEVTTELAPNATVDVSEDQVDAVQAQVNDAQAPKPDFTAQIKEAVDAAVKPLNERVEKAEADAKNAFNKAAQEPGFKKDDKTGNRLPGTAGSSIGDMDWKERTALQMRSLQASFRGDRDAGQTAHDINKFNFEELQKEGIVSNAVDLPDLGNFVIPRQMVTEIKEQPSNYRPILDLFRFDETMSLETAWITGTGEIQMSDVDMDDNDDNLDLKPISTPTFDTDTTRLYEFAAVTPVKASAIRFAASDLVQHLTKLYKRAYDRRLAQSVIGRLDNALDANGNSVPYNYSSAAGGNVEALITLITAFSEVAEHSPNGVFLMTESSRLHLLAMALRAGTNGPLAGIFTSDSTGVRFLGKPYAVVPGDLMPNLNSASTKSWSFEGTSTSVNHGVLLADPTDFVGKVSGGLNFQVSDVASYEESGTAKSAFQRDELVFRGYGYRASGLYFPDNVSGVLAPGIS